MSTQDKKTENWSWENVGGRYQLFADKSRVVLCGRLHELTPTHPDAKLIARAPELEAENKQLREINRELVEALETLWEDTQGISDKIDTLRGAAKAALARTFGSKWTPTPFKNDRLHFSYMAQGMS